MNGCPFFLNFFREEAKKLLCLFATNFVKYQFFMHNKSEFRVTKKADLLFYWLKRKFIKILTTPSLHP